MSAETSSSPSPRPATGKDVRGLRERVERRLWRALKPMRQRAAGREAQRFLFVAGMQRSGTNMLMETLEWAAHTDVYHETDPRTFDNYEMRPPAVIRGVARRSPAPLFVIKSLCELDRVRALMDEFAPARTVWMLRRYDDTVNSAIRSFPNFKHQALRLARDKSAADWRGRGMSDDTQSAIRRLAHAEMNEASAAALMWYYRNVLFFEQGLQADARVRVLSYEHLVAGPAHALRGVFGFIGLPGWSPWISRYVHVQSIGKSPPADIEPAVRELCDGLSELFGALGR
jgi:hypothetical protein